MTKSNTRVATGIALIGAVALIGGPVTATTAAAATIRNAGATPITFATNGADFGSGFDQHDYQDGFVAWAKQVDSTGGIDGHMIVIDRCNNQGTSTGTATCAQQQIQDSSIIAVEGFSPYSGQESGPLYKTAHLTYATPFPVSDADYVNDTMATTAGTLAALGGQPYYLAKVKGLKRIADMRVDLASTDSAPALIKASIAAGSGGTFVADITHPVTQLDFTAQIIQAEAAKAQVIFLDEEQSAIPAIFKAAVANGYKGAFALPPLHEPIVQAAFQTGVTVYADAEFPSITTSGLSIIAQFRKAMMSDHYASDMDQGALSGYGTGLLYAYAVEQIGAESVTRQSFYQWVTTKIFKNVALFPNAVGVPLAPKNLPGAINTTMWGEEFKDGSQPYISGRIDFANVLAHYQPAA